MKELKGVDENTLPKNWAIQTERQEFYSWANEYLNDGTPLCNQDQENEFVIVPARNKKFLCEWELGVPEGYELITFERWASVYRPDLVNTPEIPERWCVRRTPENAEILNAWADYKRSEGTKLYDTDCFILSDGYPETEPFEIPEITFEQWQTIPDVAEWLKTYNMSTREAILKGVISTEKVEEREIIGYEAPRDLFGKRIKAGTVFTKNAITTVSFEYIHGQTILPAEIVETWKPVYREKPVFKVGGTAVWENNNEVFVIDRISESGTRLVAKEDEAGFCANYPASQCRLATPEEIEAARPKRRYMKQVWGVESVNGYGPPTSHGNGTEKEQNDWVLENAILGNHYSVRPFLTLAYE